MRLAQKKTAVLSVSERKGMLEDSGGHLSLRRQCGLVGLNRSGLYYEPREETSYNQELMNLIDEEFTRYPFKGVGQMTSYLRQKCRKGHVKFLGVNFSQGSA